MPSPLEPGMTVIPVRHVSENHYGWRWRWLVFRNYERLHRFKSLIWDEARWAGVGTTVCGRKGALIMAGVFSRIGLPRCQYCCRMLGLPQGNGAPFNDGTLSKDMQDR